MIEIAGKAVREFDAFQATLGAKACDYPDWDALPKEYQRGTAPGCRVFSALFFNGGKLSDHGLKLKEGTDPSLFYRTLRAMMSSFDPSHELKEATCGLLIDTYTEPTE